MRNLRVGIVTAALCAPVLLGAACGAAPPATEGVPTAIVTYANCDAVRAAGAAPIHIGTPGYGSHLDRDGDGVACE